MRRVALTACCCIKNRCVAFIERKSQPTPTTTPRAAKKDDIVKEIIAELGKMDKNLTAGTRNADPQSSNVSCEQNHCSLQCLAIAACRVVKSCHLHNSGPTWKSRLKILALTSNHLGWFEVSRGHYGSSALCHHSVNGLKLVGTAAAGLYYFLLASRIDKISNLHIVQFSRYQNFCSVSVTLKSPPVSTVHLKLKVVRNFHMVNLCTKFEVYIYTRYEDTKGCAKCRKLGGLRWVGVMGGRHYVIIR